MSIDFASIRHLNKLTNAGIPMCKAALVYASGDLHTAVAYIQAKTLAVGTPSLSFDERVEFFKKFRRL